MEFLRTKDAAEYLALGKNTLEVWRVHGQGPPFVKMGKAVRYRQEDLDNFIKSSMRANTSGGKPG